jgi:hypothetical protein
VEITLEAVSPTARRLFVRVGEVTALNGLLFENWQATPDYGVIFGAKKGGCTGAKWLQNIGIGNGGSPNPCGSRWAGEASPRRCLTGFGCGTVAFGRGELREER